MFSKDAEDAIEQLKKDQAAMLSLYTRPVNSEISNVSRNFENRKSEAAIETCEPLTDMEINKMIAPSICKIIADGVEGTGFFIEPDKGILVSSFHLMGSIKSESLLNSDYFPISMRIISFLYHIGYLDMEGRLTRAGFSISASENIDLSQMSHNGHKFIERKVFLTSEKIEEMGETWSQELYVLLDSIKKNGNLLNLDSIRGDNGFLFKLLYVTGYIEYVEITAQPIGQSEFDPIFGVYFSDSGYNQTSQVNIQKTFQVTNKGLQVNTVKDLRLEICEFQPLKLESLESLDTSLPSLMDGKPDYYLEILPETLVCRERERGTSGKSVCLSQQHNIKEKIWNEIKKIKDKLIPFVPNERVTIHCQDKVCSGKIYFPEHVDKEKVLNNYAFSDVVAIQVTYDERERSLTPFEDITPLAIDNPISLKSETISLEVGEDVFFGGYPLGEQTCHLIKGKISAIVKEASKEILGIQATIVPGNSGSPIFIQRNGCIYWVGIITAEVADLQNEIFLLRDNLNANVPAMEQLQSSRQANGLRTLVNTQMANLSTGIGKALRFFQPDDIFLPRDRESLIGLPVEFLVGKSKGTKQTVELLERKSLYQYINEDVSVPTFDLSGPPDNTKHLTQPHMRRYLIENSDTKTKNAIFAQIDALSNNIAWNDDEYYIEFTDLLSNHVVLSEDFYPNQIDAPKISEAQIKALVAQGWRQLIQVQMKVETSYNTQSQKKIKKVLELLYKYCFFVSQGKIFDQQYHWGAQDEIHRDYYLTQECYDKHIGGHDRKETKGTALDKFEERLEENIKTSTQLTKTALEQLQEELSTLQDTYPKVIEAAKTAISPSEILVGLFFKAKQKYSMVEYSKSSSHSQTHTKTGLLSDNSHFYYSVISKNSGYYVNHFAGTKLDDAWKPVPFPPSVSEVSSSQPVLPVSPKLKAFYHCDITKCK